MESNSQQGFNNAASGKGANETSGLVDSLEKSIKDLMKTRYKNDPQKANKESEKLLNKMLKNGIYLQDLERKSVSQQIKDQMDAANTIAKMELASAESAGDKLKAAGKAVGTHLVSMAANMMSGVGKEIDKYANMYGQYSAKINARLQTFDDHGGKAFNDLSRLVRKNLAASPYIRQEEMLSNLDNLIAQGINYNIEQRAFLATVTDKIVTTFDTLDKTLLAMVRLQQQDTTQARMGMEAYLTKYLNSTYETTEYLNDVYDTVTQNLFEASSQLGRNASIELEYVVQKWLGSMYSVGVGESFLNTISQGLGYLGSGDIDALAGNASLQNLLVMASNRSGIEYSKILAQGLNADTANKLLSGIAQYVQEISKSNNQVVRSQYAQLFGMTLSDMTAMLNLSSKDLTSISQNMLSYGDTIKELNSQLKDVKSRMHLSDMIENVFANFMTGVAGNIAANAGSYVTWKVTDLVEQATGGIAIPTISVFGSGVDLETTVTGLMKTGIVGLSVIGQIGRVLGGLSSGGSLNLQTWSGKESTSRGSGFGAITSGYSTDTSTSAYIGSSSGSDIYSSSVTAAKDSAAEEVKGKEDEEEDILDLTKVIIQFLTEFSKGTKHIHAIVDNQTPLNVSIRKSSSTGTSNSSTSAILQLQKQLSGNNAAVNSSEDYDLVDIANSIAQLLQNWDQGEGQVHSVIDGPVTMTGAGAIPLDIGSSGL